MNFRKHIKVGIKSGIVLLLICASTIIVQAGSFSVSVSGGSVDPGGKFTVSVNVTGSGVFYFSGNNATVSASSMYCDTSCSVTAVAGSSGTASVSVTTGTPGQSDEVTDFSDDSAITGTKTVSVSIKTQTNTSESPSSNSGSNGGSVSSGGNSQQVTQNSEPAKSSDATLASLSVSEGTMSPSFKSGTSKYELSLPSDTTKIKIEAKANDSKAKVSGTGEVELKQGNNKISITVTAEDGTTKTYTINAYVEETPEVYLAYNDTKLGVVKNTDNVSKPGDAFEEVKLEIDGKEVTGWQNNIMNVTVLYMINEENGEKNFYLYDAENNILTSVFKPIVLLGNNLYIIDVDKELQTREGMTFTTVTVDEKELQGWKFNEAGFDNYCLIYVMNEQGEKQYYQYEATQNTLQLYSNAAPISTESYQKTLKTEQIAIILAGVLGVTTIVSLIGCVLIRRKSNLRLRQIMRKDDCSE